MGCLRHTSKVVKLLAVKLGERFGVEYGRMANYKMKARIQMSILGAASMYQGQKEI